MGSGREGVEGGREGPSSSGPCRGDGWESRRAPKSWETRLKGADRRLSFTFAVGTNGGTWPLELHLFEHLAHFFAGFLLSSSPANPPPETLRAMSSLSTQK